MGESVKSGISTILEGKTHEVRERIYFMFFFFMNNTENKLRL